MPRTPFLATLLVLLTFPPVSSAQEDSNSGSSKAEASQPSEASMAAYADAANFQTGGAIDLAIESWKKFRKQYPDHPMVSKASHYLGVCYMQQETPDYEKAASAFDDALQDKKYDLREESLANLGWCLYAAAGTGEERNAKKLQRVIDTYETLRKEDSEKRFVDRALFYSGEAAYGLGKSQQAISYYDELLALPNVKGSSLRCDALYARGVAQEELDQFDDAFASYQQLLDQCGDSKLAIDVHMRLGDLRIMRGEFDQAVSSFDQAIKTSPSEEDQAYALFRQAYALVQADKPGLAAEKYDTLASEYPESLYAASATLASAQSKYRSGDLDQAADGFQVVLKQNNPEAATEAAHWLARIWLSKGKPKQAAEVARTQIDQGAEGGFAIDLKLDLAESLSMDPNEVPQSLELFEQAYRESPADPRAARALYNAAFSALQIGKLDRAKKLSSEFLEKFPKDALSPDVKYISAESHFASGDLDRANEIYEQLIQQADPSGIQRPVWVLRGATASNAARKFDQTIELLNREIKSLPAAQQQAEAYLLIGQAHKMSGRLSEAAKAFDQAAEANPDGPRADEARLLRGQSLATDGNSEDAVSVWNQIVESSPKSRMADQARYKLAQLASTQGQQDKAIGLYETILQSQQDPALHPYAQYGIGFAQLQEGKYKAAAKTLDQMLDQHPKHPLRNEAVLARGIANRNLQNYDQAKADLDSFLSQSPQGTSLGHALYELALIDGQQRQPAAAAEKLARIVDEVKDYPSMDKVLYELAWAMQESGKEDEAAEHFSTLVSKYPDTGLASEAAYFLGQSLYRNQQWDQAAEQFAVAAQKSPDPALREKAWYRQGWSEFKQQNFSEAEQAFASQAEQFPSGPLSFDAQMMVGESRFKRGDYKAALEAYSVSRTRIEKNNDTSDSVRDAAERQVRELVLLHGGQSAAQLKDWDLALSWYDELRKRFSASDYLPQVFYETGFAYQQQGKDDKALKFFGEVADNYRSELAARSRFMMGEIYFAARQFDRAIPEFQKVMFGFGADKAPDRIKNWQAKSGFEAARCSELLMQAARTDAAKAKAAKIGQSFYAYVADKHADHELAEQSRQRIEALKK